MPETRDLTDDERQLLTRLVEAMPDWTAKAQLFGQITRTRVELPVPEGGWPLRFSVDAGPINELPDCTPARLIAADEDGEPVFLNLVVRYGVLEGIGRTRLAGRVRQMPPLSAFKPVVYRPLAEFPEQAAIIRAMLAPDFEDAGKLRRQAEAALAFPLGETGDLSLLIGPGTPKAIDAPPSIDARFDDENGLPGYIRVHLRDGRLWELEMGKDGDEDGDARLSRLPEPESIHVNIPGRAIDIFN